MKKTLLPTAGCLVAVLFLSSMNGCNKNATPPPPVHDTTVIVKTDTVTIPPAPDPTVNLTKGLLVYLPFSGNIADSSGNGNPTTAVGNVLTYDAHGYANNAFGATGNGERVLVTNNGSIHFDTAWSLSFGFMVNDNRFEAFINMVDPTSALGFVLGAGTEPTTYKFIGAAADASFGCGSYVSTWNGPNVEDTTNLVPLPGAWYHAIVMYHKGTVQEYINGKLISSKTVSGGAPNNCPAAQIVIGGWWNSDLKNLNGKLDNIRLYNRLLTPHEISTLAGSYQVTSNSVRPALLSH
jgi:hypothetical protein